MSAKKAAPKAKKKPLELAAEIIIRLSTPRPRSAAAAAAPASASAQEKPKNPPRSEIDPLVKALMSAKAGMNARGVDNIGTPKPLGLSETSFLELLGPFNAVIDNYEKSEALTAAELRALYAAKKKVKDVVDLVHAKSQVH